MKVAEYALDPLQTATGWQLDFEHARLTSGEVSIALSTLRDTRDLWRCLDELSRLVEPPLVAEAVPVLLLLYPASEVCARPSRLGLAEVGARLVHVALHGSGGPRPVPRAPRHVRTSRDNLQLAQIGPWRTSSSTLGGAINDGLEDSPGGCTL